MRHEVVGVLGEPVPDLQGRKSKANRNSPDTKSRKMVKLLRLGRAVAYNRKASSSHTVRNLSTGKSNGGLGWVGVWLGVNGQENTDSGDVRGSDHST